MTNETVEVLDVIGKTFLKDMTSNHDLMLKLTKNIGFEEGYNAGYADGINEAQRRMRRAMQEVQYAAGMNNDNTCE